MTDENDELIELPGEDVDLEIHPDSFAVSSGFLRAGNKPNVPRPAGDGPDWSYDEADEQAHAFLLEVAGERDVIEYIEDPVEHARVNGLMIMFSPSVQESFETYLARMPEPRAEAWRDLIAGGASSEAFGPLTLQEQIDETQVEEALQVGRRQRVINVGIALVVFAGLVVGAVAAYREFIAEPRRTQGAFVFDDLDEPPEVAALGGGPPSAEPALTTGLATAVAVAAGDGPQIDRIAVAPFSVYPHPPGSIRASLFQYAGSAQVVFVGPAGFADGTCLRASVVTDDLRPLDTVTHGTCAQQVGRPATVGCVGPTAILLDLVVPAGEVVLPEGGSGFADQVRVQLVADHPDYDVLTLRGAIQVATEDPVTVPRFGGEPGEELTFDLGADRIGRCTITGDLPGRS